ncbi:MAG: hypothetical protein ACT7A5_03705, partial [Ferrovibrionaceae bacterium]
MILFGASSFALRRLCRSDARSSVTAVNTLHFREIRQTGPMEKPETGSPEVQTGRIGFSTP